MEQNSENPISTTESVSFTKSQILKSAKYFSQKDLINALLQDGKSYTIKETDTIINNFMKGKVK